MRIRFASTRISCRSRLHPRSPRSCWRISCHRRRGRTFFPRARRVHDEQEEGHVSIRANDTRDEFFSQRFFLAAENFFSGEGWRASGRRREGGVSTVHPAHSRDTTVHGATTLLDSYVLLEEMLLDGRGAPWVPGEWQQ